MESAGIKITILVLALHIILFSGIYLRKKSRPYNNIVFAIHKIVAVIFIIFIVLVMRASLTNESPDGIFVYLLVFTAFLALTSFITGVLQSFEKPPPAMVNIIHKVSSYLLFTCLALIFIFII